MYAKLEPLTIGLPVSGRLKTGEWVSNYHLLPDKVLLDEGWKPCDEVKPECGENQVLELDNAVEIDGRILLTYKAMDVPPDEIDLMLDELEGLL